MIEIDNLGGGFSDGPADRLISAESKSTQEEAIERALRPKRLADYVGQAKIRERLESVGLHSPAPGVVGPQ